MLICVGISVTAKETNNSSSESIINEDNDGSIHITEKLKSFYGKLDNEQVPSGILLQAGAIMAKSLIEGNDENNQRAFTQNMFNDSYDELMRGRLFVKGGGGGPDLFDQSAKIRDDHLYPISLAFVEYNSIPDENFSDETNDGWFYIPPTKKNVTESKNFIATTIQAPVVYGPNAKFIVPDEFVLSHGVESITNMEFEYNGRVHPVTLNNPFEVNLISEKPNPSKPKPKPRSVQPKIYKEKERQLKNFTLRFSADGKNYSASGAFEWADPHKNLRSMRKNLPLCYDLPAVTATHAYNGEKGKLNIRVYPSNGTVSGSNINNSGCINGNSPQLQQVMIVVDGFDPLDNRTHESIYEDFGEAMDAFIDSGFDLVVVDYEDGRDYIQRNGYAIRELLVNKAPTWLADDADTRFVMTAGSMGGQTARYAMTTAENSGEDHNVRLFFAIDSPFRGANIPISIQAFTEYFAFRSSIRELLKGLNSPAASQQLRLNRYFDPNGPSYSTVESNRWYLPRDDYFDYYNETSGLGLPNQSRNVGIASGSGTGSALTPHLNYKHELNYVNWSAVANTLIIRSRSQTDHEGEVYTGRVALPVVCIWDNVPCDSLVKLILNYPKRLDIAPGGTRASPAEIKNGWNESPDSSGTMTSKFPMHSFVPTFSALNILTNDLYYNPSDDPLAESLSGFDAVWYEKCNANHVEKTDGMWNVISQELASFLSNSDPEAVDLPTRQCGRAEPGHPTAVCTIHDPYQGSGLVTFDGSNSHDAGGSIAHYSWNPGDGTTNRTGEVISYQYSAPPGGASYDPVLTVTDSEGNTGTDSCERVHVGQYK